MFSNTKGFRVNDGRSDFDKSFKRMSMFIKIFFAFTLVLIIGGWCLYGFIGVKVYNTLQENNGSVGAVLGKEYKAFQEAAK